jgi:hypothetical protein
MYIPTLPTDNLYKFIALSGVVIFLIFIIYPDFQINEVKEEIINIETEIGELEFEKNLLEERQKELYDEIEEANHKLSKYQIEDSLDIKININDLKRQLQNSDYREYLEFIYKHKENLIPEIKLQQQITEKVNELRKNNQEIELKFHKINRKLNINEEKTDEARKSICKWLIGSAIGCFMMVLGFRLWYTKSQKPMDKKLLKEIKEPYTQ